MISSGAVLESIKCKPEVAAYYFDAVICSKLLYGLETVHLTSALLKQVDAFQLRCLRRNLKLAPTLVNCRRVQYT